MALKARALRLGDGVLGAPVFVAAGHRGCWRVARGCRRRRRTAAHEKQGSNEHRQDLHDGFLVKVGTKQGGVTHKDMNNKRESTANQSTSQRTTMQATARLVRNLALVRGSRSSPAQRRRCLVHARCVDGHPAFSDDHRHPAFVARGVDHAAGGVGVAVAKKTGLLLVVLLAMKKGAFVIFAPIILVFKKIFGGNKSNNDSNNV